jgi:hypothetical protein
LCCHVPHRSGPHHPAEKGSGAAMCLVGLCRPQKLRIKKDVAGLVVQLVSRVPKTHAPDSVSH